MGELMRPVDLNLLAILEAIDRERSVTGAAHALGLSQPAVSHALSRLRHHLKDPLFIRTAAGMSPTPRADEIIGPVRQAIAGLNAALSQERFDPRTARETLTIAMNNFAAIVLAAPLVRRLTAKAPHIRVVIRPSGTLDLELLMARGQLDLAVIEVPGLAPTDSSFLLQDGYVAVTTPGQSLSLESFAGAQHLRISSIGADDAFIDELLAAEGLKRTVACEAPYLAAGAILEQTGMVTIVAQHLAQTLCEKRDLTWQELPFEAPRVTIGMTWPSLYDGREAHRWLRQEIKLMTRCFAGHA
jgi:DNA-binding transcriptional LysR family regulator